MALFHGPEASEQTPYLATSAGDWDAYAKAYKLGAETLVAHAGDSRMHLDLLALPIVFLYRHYAELRLKELIRLTCGRSKSETMTHNLMKLWQRVKPELQSRFHSSRDDLDGAEKTLSALGSLDDGSITFRYPEDKAGGTTLPTRAAGIKVDKHGVPLPAPGRVGEEEKGKEFDTRQLAEAMGELASLLDGCSMAIREAATSEPPGAHA